MGTLSLNFLRQHDHVLGVLDGRDGEGPSAALSLYHITVQLPDHFRPSSSRDLKRLRRTMARTLPDQRRQCDVSAGLQEKSGTLQYVERSRLLVNVELISLKGPVSYI